MKILLIEDSQILRKSISFGLGQLGFVVDSTGDGVEALGLILTYHYDVIVLDLMLPSLDGFSILKDLRSRKKNPNVIIISAKNQVDDRIKGLNLGADDYLCKPFEFDELVARINTVVRRSHNIHMNEIYLEKLSIDLEMRQAKINQKVINLTTNEYNFLECLALNQGRVMTYEMLENHLYDAFAGVTRNAIEAHASGLRKKLKAVNIDDLIKTRRGFGYVIEKYSGTISQ